MIMKGTSRRLAADVGVFRWHPPLCANAAGGEEYGCCASGMLVAALTQRAGPADPQIAGKEVETAREDLLGEKASFFGFLDIDARVELCVSTTSSAWKRAASWAPRHHGEAGGAVV